jgi:hypothetical protein
VEILKQNLKGAGPATVAKGSELLARAEAAEARAEAAVTQLGEALLREARSQRELEETRCVRNDRFVAREDYTRVSVERDHLSDECLLKAHQINTLELRIMTVMQERDALAAQLGLMTRRSPQVQTYYAYGVAPTGTAVDALPSEGEWIAMTHEQIAEYRALAARISGFDTPEASAIEALCDEVERPILHGIATHIDMIQAYAAYYAEVTARGDAPETFVNWFNGATP